MSAESVAAALTTAGLLGVTHAIEPDHVAGISSLTGRYADVRLSTLVGACFSLGHAALVVVWVGLASVVLGRTTFPAVYGTLGSGGAGLLLGALGVVMAVSGVRATIYEHDHGDASDPHVHLTLPLLGGGSAHGHDGHRDHDDHDVPAGGVRTYLKTGLVGALFTLSPPLSMLAFTSALLPRYDGGVVAVAVLTYTVTITATMSLVGAGAGALFGLSTARGARLFGVVQALAGVAVVALAVSMVAPLLDLHLV